MGNNQFKKITEKILKQRIEQNSKLKYLNCDYENQNSKVLLRCECGREFTCVYRKLRENNYRTRCEHCRREIANKNRAITTENRFRESEFCEKEKIKLIRIPYWEIDNVEII